MTIYWLTGVIGAGKSTLGAVLAATMPETDFIDGDFCLAQDDALSFEQRIQNNKNHLIKKCLEYAQGGRNLVVAYPVQKETVATLRQACRDSNGQLVVIALTAPLQHNDTRSFSEWELKRQQEMRSVEGAGYADIFFTHPTSYLYDSLQALKAALDKA